jgi:hypothetical protein
MEHRAGGARVRSSVAVLVCVLMAAAATGTGAVLVGPQPPAGAAPTAGSGAAPVLFDPAGVVPDTFGASPANVATGDVTGDGLIDITLALGGAWVVLPQLADGRTGAPVTVDATAGPSTFPQIADLDDDGRLDLALFRDTSDTSGTMRIYHQDQAGALVFARSVATPSIRWATTGDVTGDGRTDVVVHGANAPFSPGIFSLAQLAGGAFGAPAKISSNAAARWLRAVDVDGDHRDDLVYSASSTEWKVRYQDAAHAFGTEVSVATTLSDAPGYFEEVADVNDDGRRDLLLSVPGIGLAVAYQKADGLFAPAITRGPPGSGKLQVGDVDGDGKADVVARGPAGIAVYRQDATGVPATAVDIQVPIDDSFVLADVNGDQMGDIVATSTGLLIAFGAVHNRGPTAQALQKVTTNEGVAVDTDLLASDPDADPLTLAIATGPVHGSVSGQLHPSRYTPTFGFYGTDSYTYRVTDGKRKFASGRVDIDVLGYTQLHGTVDDGYAVKLAGIKVTAYRWADSNWQLAGSTVTDANGLYSFTTIPAGDLSLYFEDLAGAYGAEWYDDAPSWGRTPIPTAVHQPSVANASLSLLARSGRPIVVTSTADGGPGSLRQAVGWANASDADDIITLGTDQVYVLGCAEGGELESKHGHLEIQAQGSTIRQTCPGHRVIDQSQASGGEANLVIRNATIEGGTSTGCGGGLYGSFMAVYDTTVRGNTSDADGGGICADMVTVSRSTVAGNHAGGNGGGISANRLWLTDSTIDGNEAEGTGGGIALSPGQSFLDELHFSTITNNRGTPVANLSGDPMWGDARGTVIGGAGSAANCTSLAHMTSKGYNYTDDATCGLAHATDVVDGPDPGLAPLADNGGQVPTRQPLVGSPLRDAIPPNVSFCTGYDARGGARPAGAGCDIGAMEAGAPAAVAPGAPTAVTATAQTEQAQVSWNAPPPVTGGVTSYTATASPGGRACSMNVVTGSEPLSCIVYGLEGGITYTFTVRATGRGGAGPASAPSAPLSPPGAATLFRPMAPVRKMDTRLANATPSGPIVAGTPVSLSLDLGPSVKAAVMNVTVTQATHGSFLTVYAGDTATPGASSINFGAGETIANQVTVPVHNGKVSFANAVGSVHVIADVVGTYTTPSIEGTGDRFTSLTPTRLLDSRTSSGGWNAPLLAGDANTRNLVATQQGVPADATAVVLNVTATASTTGSFLHVFPAGTPRGPGSNVNFGAGQTIANQVTVQTGTNGQISFFNAAGSVHLTVDVVGYYRHGPGQYFHVVAPTRLLDDRAGIGVSGPWGPGQSREIEIAGVANIPVDASVVVANLTATNATVGSYVTAYPAATAKPTASTLNFGPGQTIANGTTTRLGEGPALGSIALANHLGSVDLIADVSGYFSAG